jgi:pimeloyl-ACP methyl ester carboxylesterase
MNHATENSHFEKRSISHPDWVRPEQGKGISKDSFRIYPNMLSFIRYLLSAAQSVLTVINGSGSGVYEVNSVAHIWANPYEDSNPERALDEPEDPGAPRRIFDKWMGDIVYLADTNSAHTTLVMPENDVTVTAQYKDSPHWVAPRIISYFPPNHKGVIFVFHGHGGRATSWVNSIESRIFFNDANSRGYAVIVLDSFDRVENVWDEDIDVSDNIDLQRVVAVREDLILQGKMDPTDAIYVLGISNGGLFASLFDAQTQESLGFSVLAAAIYISTGDAWIMEETTVPTIFALAENDSAYAGAINPGALKAFHSLFHRGVPTQYWANPASPIYPERFWRIDGLSQTDSEAIYTALKNADFLDENDFLWESPLTSNWKDVIPSEYEQVIFDIQEQLVVGFAEHQFTSDFNHKVFSFFDNPTTIVEQVPEIDSFWPPSGQRGTVVTVDGKNFIAITLVTFNGVDADFTILTDSQLFATVPSGVTTGPIAVTNPAGTGISDMDFELTPVQITGFNPESGPVGTTVTIDGVNLMDAIEVTFNGTAALILGSLSTNIWVRVPEGATTGPIQVTTLSGSATSATDFTVLVPPTISGFSPTSGSPDTEVTITGTNLIGTTQVSFGVIAAFFIVDSETQVRALVPNEAFTSLILVYTPGGTAISASAFRVLK